MRLIFSPRFLYVAQLMARGQKGADLRDIDYKNSIQSICQRLQVLLLLNRIYNSVPLRTVMKLERIGFHVNLLFSKPYEQTSLSILYHLCGITVTWCPDYRYRLRTPFLVRTLEVNNGVLATSSSTQ